MRFRVVESLGVNVVTPVSYSRRVCLKLPCWEAAPKMFAVRDIEIKTWYIIDEATGLSIGSGATLQDARDGAQRHLEGRTPVDYAEAVARVRRKKYYRALKSEIERVRALEEEGPK